MFDQQNGREGLYTPAAQRPTKSDPGYDGLHSEHNGEAGDSSDDRARSYPGTEPVPIAAGTPECALPASMRAARRWLVHRDKRPFYVDGTPRSGVLDSPEDVARLATYDEAARVHAAGTYSGLGFALGPDGSGKCWQGIDLDDVVTNQLADLANSLPSYVEMSPSEAGCHAIGYGRPFRSIGNNGTGVEAYASGRYFTVTERPIRPIEVIDLADYVEQVVSVWYGRARTAGGGKGAVAIDPRTASALRSALAFMRSDDYDLWIRMGLALHELGETGRGLWIEWSQTSDKYAARETAKKWEGFRPQATGYQAVFAEAQRQGWVNPSSNAARLPDPQESPASGAELIAKLSIEYESDEWIDVPDIVQDLVADEELTLLGGHGGVGKSYFALLIACCVALGRGLFGKRVPKARRVLYYSAEDGSKRITRRVRQICREYSMVADDLRQNLLVVDATEQQPLYGETIEQIESDDGKGRPYFNKVMGSTADFESLQAMVRVFDPDLLIVDGASDTYDGNEIARRDVRAFIRMMQRVHPARRIGVLMLVHVDRSSARGNVTDDDGYSGSSQWHNAARRRLYLRPEPKTETVWLKVMKNQDGPPAPDIALCRKDGVLMPLVSLNMGGTDLKAERSAVVLKLIDEYTQRGQSISTSLAPQATTGVFSTLKGDPAFPPGLDREATCQIVRDARRLGVLVEEDYEYSRGKFKPRWRVKLAGMGADAPSETPAEPAAGSAQGEA